MTSPGTDAPRPGKGRGPAATLALLALLGLAAAAAPRPAPAAAERFEIDPDHLSVGFLVSHVGYAGVLGMFREAGGRFSYDEDTGRISDVRIVIRTASVFTNHEERDGHLRGEDFLDVARHPEMVFTAGAAEPAPADAPGRPARYRVQGELELLGRSRPVTLDLWVNKQARYPLGLGGVFPPYVVGVSGRGSFKRSDYGMDYAVENGWVGDEIRLIIEFEARRQ